jgi:hypothetical protein
MTSNLQQLIALYHTFITRYLKQKRQYIGWLLALAMSKSIEVLDLQSEVTKNAGKMFRLSKQIHQEDTMASDVVYYASKRLLVVFIPSFWLR